MAFFFKGVYVVLMHYERPVWGEIRRQPTIFLQSHKDHVSSKSIELSLASIQRPTFISYFVKWQTVLKRKDSLTITYYVVGATEKRWLLLTFRRFLGTVLSLSITGITCPFFILLTRMA